MKDRDTEFSIPWPGDYKPPTEIILISFKSADFSISEDIIGHLDGMLIGRRRCDWTEAPGSVVLVS